MVREAEQNAAEDKNRRELVEARHLADSTIYTAEKMLQEAGGQAGAAERKPVEDAIAAVREAVSGEDADHIRQRLESLAQAIVRHTEATQGGAASVQGAGPAGGAQQRPVDRGEGVVDAEFEEVDGSQGKRR